MRVKPLLLLLLFSVLTANVKAQMFPDRNLYDIWMAAEKHLDAGRFENAIKLYEGRQDVPEFQKRLKITKRLQTIFQTGDRFYRSKKYAEALEVFSKYRPLDRDLHVTILDDRIQDCLKQLEKVLKNRLDEKIRVIAGFEWAYKGDKQLSVMDTTAAQKSFLKAKQLGGGLNATLREQYQEGLLAVQSLRSWGNEYRNALAANDHQKALELLKAYRSASKYIINDLENEIRSVEEEVSPATSPITMLEKYATECRIEDLSYYIRSNRKVIQNADQRIIKINEYKQIQNTIAQLKKDPGNHTFLESAYESLIDKGAEIPEVGTFIQVCAKKDYYDYLIGLALLNEKAGDESNLKARYPEAIRYVVEAKQLQVVGTEASISQIQTRLASKLGCEGTQRDFERAIVSVRRELSNCRIVLSKNLWDDSVAKLVGCNLDNASYLNKYATLQDSVSTLYSADSLYSSLSVRAKRALDSKQCSEARILYNQMSRLEVCNTSSRDSVYTNDILRLVECERSSCFSTAVTSASLSAENKEWKQAYDYYKAAYECATPPQKTRIEQILIEIECDAYPEKCKKRGVAVSVEPTLRFTTNKPKYTEDGFAKGTTFGYFTSGGIQLSFLSYETPVDFILGVEYFRTQFQSTRISQGTEHASGEFDISGADAYVAFKLHKTNLDPNRIRPYLKGGLELLLPTSYYLRDIDNSSRTTNNRANLKRQSLGVIGGAGIELQRRKFGFFIELTGGYNFSGIYNADVISASGAKGITEANFRMVGIRAGLRFW